jgi:hypothetical protein
MRRNYLSPPTSPKHLDSRDAMKHTLILLTALLLAPLAALHAAETSSVEKSDVIVYGSTPGGFCAAIAAAREGASVVLERKRGQDSLILHNYHEMTHHGEDSKLLEWLTKVDTWYSAEWAYFIEKLKSVKEGNETLLDHTLLAWSSSGGTLNAHNNTELPAMLFGGKALGIKHQGHLSQKDTRLGNLWQSYFQVLGVKVPDNFQGGEADGIIKELV